MAANDEVIGGVAIGVTGDFSELDAQFDAAIQRAQERSGAMAAAIQDGVKAPDISPVTEALGKIGESAQKVGQEVTDALRIEAPAIDTSGAVSSLTALGDAASTTSQQVVSELSQIQAPAIDTAPAVSSLEALAASVQGTLQDIGAEFNSAATGEDAFNAALNSLVSQGASVNEAFQQLTGSSQSFIEALQSGALEQFMADFGKVQSEAEGAASGLQEVGSAATTAAGQMNLFDESLQIPVAEVNGQLNLFTTELEQIGGDAQTAAGGVAALGSAMTTEGSEAAAAAGSVKQFSDAAQSIVDKQNAADAALRDAQGALAEIQHAYETGAASANTLARAADDLKQKFDAANPSIRDTGSAADIATSAFNGMNSILGALGVSLSLAGFVKFAESVGEAADATTRANIALTALTGDAKQAADMLDRLSTLGVQDGLSLPGLQQALTRMQSILPDGRDLVGILGQLADASAVTGVSVGTLADKLDRVVESGKISPAVLKSFGLSMDDLGAAMETAGVSADKMATGVKKAFDSLSAGDQITTIQIALQKFQGVAEDVATRTFGGIWKSAMAEWDKDLETIQKDLGDVSMKALGSDFKGAVDFAASLFVSFGTLVKITSDQISGDIKILGVEFNALGAAAAQAFQGNFAGAATIMGNALAAVEGVVKDTETKINADLDSGAKIVQDIMNRTSESIKTVIPQFDNLGRAGKDAADKVSASFHDYDSALREFADISSSVTSDEQHQSDMMEALANKIGDAAKSLDNAKQNLGFWIDKLNQAETGSNNYVIAQQQVDKWLAQVEKDQTALNKAQDDYNNKSGASVAAVDAWKEHLSQANGVAYAMAGYLDAIGVKMDTIPPKMDPVNKALSDFHDYAEAAGKPAQDLKADVDGLVADLPGLDTALANNKISLDTFDKNIGTVFTDIQRLAKTDLPSAIRDISTTIDDLIKNQHWDQATAGVKEYEGFIQKLAQTDLPGAAAATQDLVNKLSAMKAPLGDILQAWGNLYQAEITYYEKTGQDASAAIYNLEQIKLRQDILKDSADGLAKTYVAMFEDINKGFDQMAEAMSQAIVNGNNLGDALVGVFKKIATSILDDLIKGALKPLEDELKKAEADLLGMLGGGSGSGGGAAGAAAGAAGGVVPPAQAGGATSGSGSGATGGSGAGGALGTAGAIGAIVGAVGQIVGDVFLKAISEKLFNIQTSLLAIQNDAANRRKDAWDQFGTTYDRIGEILTDTHSMSDTLKQILAAGAGGGFPQQALQDLDTIAQAAQQQYMMLPTILGSLSTIASDLVTGFQEIESNYLSVIVTKLGEILTNGLTSGDLSAQTDSLNQDFNALNDLVSAGAHDVQSSVGDLSGDITNGFSSNAAVVGGAINRQGDLQATRDAAQLSAAQAAERAATDTAGQIDALRQEYASDVALMNDAIKNGDLALADQYRQAAANVQGSLLPLLSDTAVYTRDAADTLNNMGPTLGKQITGVGEAATNAGTIVSMHVDAAAVSIGTAVSAAVAAVGFHSTGNPSTGGGSTTNYSGGNSSATPTGQPGTGVPTGTQPGYSPQPLQPTNGIPTPTGNGNPQPGGNPSSPMQYQPGSGLPVGSQGTTQPDNGYTFSEGVIPPPANSSTEVPSLPPLKGGPVYPSSGSSTPIDATAQAAVISASIAKLQAQIDTDTKAGNTAQAQAEQAQLVALKQELDILQKLAVAQLELKDAQASGNTQLMQVLQAQLTTLQQQLTVAQSAADAAAGKVSPPALSSGLSAHPGLVGQPISTTPEPTSPGALAAQAIQVQMQQIQAQLDAAKNKLAATEQQANQPGQFGNPDLIKQELALNQQIQQMTEQLKLLQVAYNDAQKSSAAPSQQQGLSDAAIQKIIDLQAKLADLQEQQKQPGKFGDPAIIAAETELTKQINDLKQQGGITTAQSDILTRIAALQQQLAGLQTQSNQPGQFGNPAIIQQEAAIQKQIQDLQNSLTATTSTTSSGGTSTSTGAGGSGGGYSSGPDPQTLGFYAGALAELEDIRNTIHIEAQLISSMRDSWVAFQVTSHNDSMIVGQAIIDALGSDKKLPIKSFDLGGSVTHDMIAQVHAGEEVLAPDISTTLRRMLSTPSSLFAHPNPAGDARTGGTRIISVNAPITINGAKGGRANAEEFVQHLRRIIPDSNGFSS